jgi:PKD repeat protein
MKPLQRAFCTGLFALGFAVLAASAQAATANFQANCSYSGSNINCVFDANRPTSSPSRCGDGSYPTAYFWDFGDGGSVYGATSAFVGHTYYAPLPSWYEINLTIFCTNTGEQSVTKTRDICRNFGAPGCIYVDGTWY